ncbi:hypothetical protein [Saccharopolyspora shandongensis]|uniref:hypothetical protein n=1 Tax=Saccharopolyspora shandongensis TaxID=418495 RepID=UPI0033C8B44F
MRDHPPGLGVLLGQLAPAGDGHHGGGHRVDVFADGGAVGFVGAELVGVAGWVADFDGVEAPFGDGVGVVGSAA